MALDLGIFVSLFTYVAGPPSAAGTGKTQGTSSPKRVVPLFTFEQICLLFETDPSISIGAR